ncbi:acetoacetate decarboxylase family protein [Amycolatopsis acidiphila]|uniref:acetoacetate decarboxylase family protein n=1 Tax=Amycolatopsis acidiphila TaxID=715473 RepID=UPI0027E538C4|nr:acetoacetate decarboxylase family protein [Amycolatopsis acidiphila]
MRPVTVLGRAVVATAFVDYLPGGLLPYHELLAAVVVRRGRRLGLTITDIWVDSPASRAGGRELWGSRRSWRSSRSSTSLRSREARRTARCWRRPPCGG